MNNPDSSIEDHKNSCTKNNFGVNKVVLNPKCLPLSKTLCDLFLHITYSIVRRILHWFRKHIDRHEE